MLMEAFADGLQGHARIIDDGRYQPGPAAFYGVEPPTLQAWKDVQAAGETFWYVDNGYFRSTYQGGNYFRITKNAEQHTGIGQSDGRRFAELGIEIQPWREGEEILIALQTDWWYERHGLTRQRWLDDVLARVSGTGRKIRIRGKPVRGHKEPPLAADLKRAWCVIAYSSNVAVDALMAGIPAFCTCPGSAGYTLSGCFLSSGGLAPYRSPHRREWAEVLADNQWTVEEIRSGLAWEMLNA